jgi:release factor glutamine methyltransferase
MNGSPMPPTADAGAVDVSTADVVARLRAAGCVFAEAEAELLLAAAAQTCSDQPRADAYLYLAEVDRLVARRVAGEPLEHVVGWAEFCGLRIAVGPGAFVPRRRSEFLVAQAAEAARAAETATGRAPVIVDLCCGTGAIAAALAEAVPGTILHAADIDPAQTAWARRNLPPTVATVHDGDLFDALPATLRGRVDIVVANAPYVPTTHIETLPPEARDHEPATALDGGSDGAALHWRIAAEAADWLAPNGRLLIETSERQIPLTTAAFQAGGLEPRVMQCDELDATVVIGARRWE